MASITAQDNVSVSDNFYDNDTSQVFLCLICNSSINYVDGDGNLIHPDSQSPSSLPHSPSSQILSKQLNVYFILRHVLELPSEHLENFLRHCPHPEEWVRVCGACRDNHVDVCRRIFAELVEVKRRFATARIKLIGAVKSSVEAGTTERGRSKCDDDDGQGQRILDISREARLFVVHNDYEHSDIDPFIAGNVLATEKLLDLGKTAMENDASSISHLDQVIPSDLDIEDVVKTEPLSSDNDHAHFKEDPFISGELDVVDGNGNVGDDDQEIKVRKRSRRTNQDKTDIHGTEENANVETDSVSEADSGEDDWIAENISESESESGTEVDSPPECNDEDEEIKGKVLVKDSSKRRRVVKVKSLTGNRNNTSRILKLFQCDQCSETLSTEKLLRDHQIFTHGTNLYVCTECGWKTPRETILADHMKRHHGDEKDLKELTCPMCNKILSSKSNLNNHIASLHSGKRRKFNCQHCDKVYNSKSQLLTHMGCVHGIKDKCRFHCTFEGCGKSFFKRSQLESHEDHHKPPQFECQFCGEKFVQKWSFQRHEKSHKLGGAKPFQCELCHRSFTRKDNLNSHVKTMHKDGAPRVFNRPEKTTTKIHKCSECDLTFIRRKVLQQHSKEVHGQEVEQKQRKSRCENKGNKEESTKIKKPGPTDNLILIKCQECFQEFNSNLKFRRHQIQIHKTNLYHCTHCDCNFEFRRQMISHTKLKHKAHKETCHICQKEFTSKQRLKFHMYRKHSGKFQPKTVFKCKNCNVEFTQRLKLYHHMGIAHGIKDDWKYRCSFEGCRRLFYVKSQLKQHENVHKTTASNYECDKCGKLLRTEKTLKTHMLILHSSDEDKTFLCELCPARFATKTLLNAHVANQHNQSSSSCPVCGLVLKNKNCLDKHVERVHEKKHMVPCDICGKLLAGAPTLRQHQWRVHRVGSVKPATIPCTVEGCDKKFAYESQLQKHVRIRHEGHRPYQCHLCGTKVQDKTYLRCHILAMHTNKDSKPFKCDECGKGFAVKEYLRYHKTKTHGHGPKKEEQFKLQQL